MYAKRNRHPINTQMLVSIFVLVTLWIMLLGPGSALAAGPGRVIADARPIEGSLSLLNPIGSNPYMRPIRYWVMVDQELDIEFTAERRAFDPLAKMRLEIALPKGIQRISGKLAGQSAERTGALSLKARASKIGEWQVSATAAIEGQFTTSFRIVIVVTETEREALEQSGAALKAEREAKRVPLIHLAKGSVSKDVHRLSAPSNYAHIDGVALTYQYANGKKYPLRGVQVELWEDRGIWPDSKIATVYTVDPVATSTDDYGLTEQNYVIGDSWHNFDNSGYFNFGNVYVGAGKNLFFKIVFIYHSEGDGETSGGTEKLVVKEDRTGPDIVIRIESERFYASSGSEHTIGFGPDSLGSSGLGDEAAHVYYDIVKTFRYFKYATGYTHGNVTAFIDLPDTSAPGCSGYRIDYDGWTNDYLTYEDTDSIIHEYSHSIHYGMRGGSFPPYSPGDTNHGNCNNTTSADALTEGWARFVPTRINKDANYHWGSTDSTVNLDIYTWGCTTDTDRDEWTFGAILWDLWEDVGSGTHLGFDHIADTLRIGDANLVREFYDDFIQDWGLCEETWEVFSTHNVRYTQLYTLTTSVSPSGGGSIDSSPSPNCGSRYTSGTQVQLTANPASEYEFDYWSGDAAGCGSNPSCTITMNGNKSVTAHFKLVCTDPPTMPYNPSPSDGASNVSINADLSWSGGHPCPGESVTYDVYLEANDSSPDNLICNDVSSPFCDPGTLNYDTHYYWKVVANGLNGPTYGPVWDFTTQTGSPGAFSKSSPSNGATGVSTDPTLSWGSSSGATSYEYCIDTTDNSTCDGSWTDVGSSTSVSLSGLSEGTTYYWQVRARNAAGTTEANGGTWWHFTTQVGLPGAFSKSSPANGATGIPTNPTLTWGSSSGATSYEYCIDTTDNSTCDGSWTNVGNNTSVGLSGLSEGTTYYWQVRARNAAGTTEANGGTWWHFTTQGGVSEAVLLVDDDEGDSYGANYETYYQNALSANGYSFDNWDVAFQGSPSLSTLQNYSTVIWFTGDDWLTTLTDIDQANLQAYLDGGGNLFISGQDIGYDLTDNGSAANAFFTDYLHASYVQDDVNLYELGGVSGDPIGDGLYLIISGGDGANNQGYPSEIDPLPPAVTVFNYGTFFISPPATSEAIPEKEKAKPSESRNVSMQGTLSSGSGAIRVCTKTYKVVYFAFGFEAISNATDRNTVMGRVMDWLSSPCRHSYCFGDFDCDCRVGVQDVMQVASRWRMTDADDGWDSWYDLDNDGKITVVDIMKVVARWGETCE